MKNIAAAAVLLAACAAIARNPAGQKPVTLMAGLSNLHHPVSTTNTEAQQFFDQGLRLVYAFNHEEAARAFQRAAELDPQAGDGMVGYGAGRRTQLQPARRSGTREDRSGGDR